MNRPEAERLLGGYATGTLTDAEKRTLFEAALEHQELFDALMDEEALRELLADPVARQRLLAVLLSPVRAFWRRPAVLGLAASLFLLVTTSLLVLRRPVVPSTLALQRQVETTEKLGQTFGDSAPSVPGKPLTVAPMASPDASRSKAVAPSAHARIALKPAPPAQSLEPTVEAPKEWMAPAEAEASAQFQAERKTKARSVQATTGAMAKSAEGPAPVPAAAGAVAMADGQVAKAEVDEPRGSAANAVAGMQVKPILERLNDGRYRLRVVWSPGGYLYVLKRRGSTVSVLVPVKSTSSSALFLFSLDDPDVIDLYVMPEPVGNPVSLPASGSISGYRRRLHSQ